MPTIKTSGKVWLISVMGVLAAQLAEVTVACVPASVNSTVSAIPILRPENTASLQQILESIRATNNLPALAAAVIRSGKVSAAGAVGVRRAGSNAAVTLDDKFHIGSCTKSMTATLAAMLVSDGKILWTSTLEEVFPELLTEMKPAWRGVTLEQLLANRGGAPHAVEKDLWTACWRAIGPAPEHRQLLLRGTLRGEPEAPPGTKYIYSNTGFAMAGAMLERVMGVSWESLMRERIFLPLNMESAGFGAPASEGTEDQPWGHVQEGTALKPVPPGPKADNPPAIGPAGTVHCSILDLAGHAAFHLSGTGPSGRLLSRDFLDALHRPAPGQTYALGWDTVRRDWAGGTALTHNGSNTMFYSVIWIAPLKDFAVVVATNLGGDTAARACDQASWILIKRFLLEAED